MSGAPPPRCHQGGRGTEGLAKTSIRRQSGANDDRLSHDVECNTNSCAGWVENQSSLTTTGTDQRVCPFLRVEDAALLERVLTGATDQEALEW